VNPREAARKWIAETLRKHLRAELHPVGDLDRIALAAEVVEAEAYRTNMLIEEAIDLAIAWAEQQNNKAGLKYAIN
jgi:hypothetical protein